jgi:putative hydrolase of the HAD superfamily
VLYSGAQETFRRLIAPYYDGEALDQRLYDTEMRNLEFFGYGIKGFTLSLIETAIELSEGRIHGHEIQKIIDLARDMLRADIELLDHVEEAVTALAGSHRLMIITKGDLLDQELKIARSGLGRYIEYVEIVADKRPERYAAILARYGVPPDRFLMVGNSLRSDVLPVLAIGGNAVHIPYRITWAHEAVGAEEMAGAAIVELEHIGQLPALVARLEEEPA